MLVLVSKVTIILNYRKKVGHLGRPDEVRNKLKHDGEFTLTKHLRRHSFLGCSLFMTDMRIGLASLNLGKTVPKRPA